jgi:hypothetical protein
LKKGKAPVERERYNGQDYFLPFPVSRISFTNHKNKNGLSRRSPETGLLFYQRPTASANFHFPFDVVVNAEGVIYETYVQNHCIRKPEMAQYPPLQAVLLEYKMAVVFLLESMQGEVSWKITVSGN